MMIVVILVTVGLNSYKETPMTKACQRWRTTDLDSGVARMSCKSARPLQQQSTIRPQPGPGATSLIASRSPTLKAEY